MFAGALAKCNTAVQTLKMREGFISPVLAILIQSHKHCCIFVEVTQRLTNQDLIRQLGRLPLLNSSALMKTARGGSKMASITSPTSVQVTLLMSKSASKGLLQQSVRKSLTAML